MAASDGNKCFILGAVSKYSRTVFSLALSDDKMLEINHADSLASGLDSLSIHFNLHPESLRSNEEANFKTFSFPSAEWYPLEKTQN